jgi:DNA recombination protein RmuC
MVAVLLLTIAAAALLAGLLVVLARSGRTLLDERLGGIEHRLDRRLGEFDERVDRRLEGIDGRPSTHRATGDTETRIVERLTKLDGTTAQMLERAADLTRLEQALRPPKARGGFGELLLENLLRDRLPPSAYEMQYGFKSGERVDAVIRVERLIPVDAKFPLDNFERMVEAEDDAARVLHEKAFARDIKGHVDAIAEKYIAR